MQKLIPIPKDSQTTQNVQTANRLNQCAIDIFNAQHYGTARNCNDHKKKQKKTT